MTACRQGILLGMVLMVVGCAMSRGQGPGPKVSGAEFRGEICCESGARAHVLFQDGGQSIAVPGGTLWVFGDTFMGTRPEPKEKPHFEGACYNTIALLPEGQHDFPPALQYLAGDDGIAVEAIELAKDQDREKFRIWPGGGVTVGGRIYLFYDMIEVTDGPPPWNFHSIGSGLAVADQPLSVFHRLDRDGEWRYPLLAADVLSHDGYLYLYEVSSQEKQKGLLLARVRPEQIENPAAYRFYTGSDWSAKHEDARAILDEAYGQISIEWNDVLGAFLLVTSSDFFHAREIQFRTGANPWGPWSRPTHLAVQPRTDKETNLVYCTYIHPELSSDDGSRLVLTFCRMLKGNWELSSPEWVSVRVEAAE